MILGILELTECVDVVVCLPASTDPFPFSGLAFKVLDLIRCQFEITLFIIINIRRRDIHDSLLFLFFSRELVESAL